MKLFFATGEQTPLADQESAILRQIRETLLTYEHVEEACHPETADAIVLQEEKTTFKEFRYVDKLLKDPFISEHLTKIFTICTDDSSTGLLRGLYTSMPRYRYDARLHRIVPFFEFTNPFVFNERSEVEPQYLAGWYGNTKSNKLREKLLQTFRGEQEFCLKTSHAWYNHKDEEQIAYVALIKACKFSLCPAGWAPPSPRIYESMALGRCPVIIADHFAPPIGPKWEEFALLYSPHKSLKALPAFLRGYETAFQQLGAKAKENWERFFEGDLLKRYYANSLLSLIETTSTFSRDEEIRRWKSFSTYWNNKWTVPQRVASKCRIFLFH